MTQSDYEFNPDIWTNEIMRRMIENIEREEMAKKAERVPKKYVKTMPAKVGKQPARKKTVPKKPDSIYPPWPKADA